jgi:hypothetical protein
MQRNSTAVAAWRASDLTRAASTIAVALAVAIAAMAHLILRSGNHVVDRFLPGWPWW